MLFVYCSSGLMASDSTGSKSGQRLMKPQYPAHFSAAFIRYCEANSIGPECFAVDAADLPRYIRCTPALLAEHVGADQAEALRRRVAVDFGDSTAAVPWLPLGFFTAPRSVSVPRSALHQRGLIASMDASSVCTVMALNPQPDDLVLDLCCCPGMKLALIADTLRGGSGECVGVDVSITRLFVARAQLRKLQAHTCRVYHCDALHFSPSNIDLDADAALFTDPKKFARSVQGYHDYLLRQRKRRREETLGCADFDSDVVESPRLIHAGSRNHLFESAVVSSHQRADAGVFDRVLVDVECTHDGSLSHVAASPHSRGAEEKETRDRFCRMNMTLDDAGPDADDEAYEGGAPLRKLQLGILRKALSLVKVGGTVVYSTCSFSRRQNEEVVAAAITESSGAVELIPCFEWGPAIDLPLASFLALEETAMKHLCDVAVPGFGGVGVRVLPQRARTSFQFIAKLRKVAQLPRDTLPAGSE